jgi:outer membrane protein, heavy metal efflux system
MRFQRANIACFLTSNMRPMMFLASLRGGCEIYATVASGTSRGRDRRLADAGADAVLCGAEWKNFTMPDLTCSWRPAGAATAVLSLLLALGGCAAVPADRGYGDVAGALEQRGLRVPEEAQGTTSQRVTELLAAPLTPEAAVSVAFLRNPAWRIQYANLGLAQAEVLNASRLSNPRLSADALHTSRSDDDAKLTFGLVQNFNDILFWGPRNHIARSQLERNKRLAGEQLLGLAADVMAAYYRVAAAEQLVAVRRDTADTASAAAALAQRFYAAGNIDERAWRLEQAGATTAAISLDAAMADVATARTALDRAMGLEAAEYDWAIDAALPGPVVDEDDVASLRVLAKRWRFDRAAGQADVEVAMSVRDLERRLRWFGVIEVGATWERDTDGAHLVGPQVSLQLPIFNQGQDAVLRGDATLELAQARLAAIDVAIGNEVTEAYDRMLAARTRVGRVEEELIPQREAVVARTLEMQNYMLLGQFDLLAERSALADAHDLYVQALGDYWQQRVELGRRVGTSLPSDARIVPAATAPEVPAMPMERQHQHAH